MDFELEIIATLILNMVDALTVHDVQALIQYFGSAVNAVHEDIQLWLPVLKENEKLASVQSQWEFARKSAEQEYLFARKLGVKFFLRHTGFFPALLKEIINPPPIIYVKGELLCDESRVLAIVGSRYPTPYGEKITKNFSRELSGLGVITVSGLARGIDSIVHKESMASNGKTWAVVGCGLSNCYPPENKKLMETIADNGAVISEFPLATKPFPGNFPRRNRIISGLSAGTLLVEGTRKSGSLITARYAADEGRSVMAVPGPITSLLSEAPHLLIQSGAKLVQSIEDIAEELPNLFPSTLLGQDKKNSEPATCPKAYQDVLDLLHERPLSRDAMIPKLNKSPAELSSLLFEMEVGGWIKILPNGCVALG